VDPNNAACDIMVSGIGSTCCNLPTDEDTATTPHASFVSVWKNTWPATAEPNNRRCDHVRTAQGVGQERYRARELRADAAAPGSVRPDLHDGSTPATGTHQERTRATRPRRLPSPRSLNDVKSRRARTHVHQPRQIQQKRSAVPATACCVSRDPWDTPAGRVGRATYTNMSFRSRTRSRPDCECRTRGTRDPRTPRQQIATTAR